MDINFIDVFFVILVLWGFWKAYESRIFCFPSVFSGSAGGRKPKPTCATPKAVGLPRRRQRRRVSGPIGSLAWHQSPQRRSTTIPMASIRRDMRQQGKTLSGTHIHTKNIFEILDVFLKFSGVAKKHPSRAFWRTLLRRRIRNETIRDVCLLHFGGRAFSSGENPEALYMQVFCTARDKSQWITVFGSSNKLSVRAYFAHFCSVLSDCKPTAKQSASIDNTSLRKMSAARS